MSHRDDSDGRDELAGLDLRGRVFDHWMGDLSDLEATGLEEALASDPALARFYERVENTLEAADAEARVPWSDDRKARVWAEVEARLKAADTGPAPRTARQPVRSRWWLVAAAAVLMAGLGVFWAVRSLDGGGAGEGEREAVVEGLESDVVEADVAASHVEPAEPGAAGSPQHVANAPIEADAQLGPGSFSNATLWLLEEQVITELDGTVFASPGADFSQATRGGSSVLELRAGTLVVEYLPNGSEALVVVTPDATIRVTGTVFYVSVRPEGTSVGVVVGAVDVAGEGGVEVALRGGTELDETGRLRSVPPAFETHVGSMIDLTAHLGELERRARQAAPEAQRVARSESGGSERGGRNGQPEPPSPEALRERADRALERGDHAESAELLERYVGLVTEGSREEKTARLDLARLYSRFLDRPSAAVPHLRRFLEAWPDDVAAAAARLELCELTGEGCR